MKKFVALLMLVIVVATLFCGCGKFTCDICGEEKTGRKYTEEIMGEKISYCKDCKEDLEALGNMFG